MADYVLRGGQAGAVRLRLLDRVMWPSTRALLRRVGLRRGMRCLDVGCGIGAVSRRIARLVAPSGLVVGVDYDAACIDLARQAATQFRWSLSFQQANAEELSEPPVYDIVYSRFLLAHLARPERALANMLHATLPGGLVVVEDIDFAGHFCHPACPAFEWYVSLFRKTVQRLGGDADFGPRLFGLFLDAGIEDVQMNVILPTYHEGAGKRIAPVTLEHIREAVVAAGLATHAEIDTAVAELNTFAADPGTLISLPHVFQVWGRKKR